MDKTTSLKHPGTLLSLTNGRLIDIRHLATKVGYRQSKVGVPTTVQVSSLEMTVALPRCRDAIRSAKSKYRHERDGGFLRDVQLIIDLTGAAWFDS